jgi:hypothetical protein
MFQITANIEEQEQGLGTSFSFKGDSMTSAEQMIASRFYKAMKKVEEELLKEGLLFMEFVKGNENE